MATSNDCPICLQSVSTPGVALFVAECAHSFHFRCIESNAKAGNTTCPLCRMKWTTLPFSVPTPPPPPRPPTPSAPAPWMQNRENEIVNFNDDEPLEARTQTAPPSVAGSMSIVIQAERKAVAHVASQSLSALVSVKAPMEDVAGESTTRDGVDLIAVLDVSGSMSGTKITNLRQTLLLALELLGPSDRLSLIKFESTATRLTPLSRMTEAGQRAAREAIVRLSANGGTDICAGLAAAAAVATGRRHRNPVCGILLLTDGQDGRAKLAFPPLVERARAGGATVSAFGYGGDHDSHLLEAIAEAGHGSFTYIQQPDTVRETFGRCLGSLFSVAAQSIRLDLRPANGATLAAVVAADGVQSPLEGGGTRLELGEMFREESRDLIVELSLPAVDADGGAAADGPVYLVAEVTWLPPGAAEAARRAAPAAELRTRRVAAEELASAAEAEAVDPAVAASRSAVERHRNRLQAVDALVRASALSDAGQLDQARSILTAALRQVERSSVATEDFGRALVADLQEAMGQMSSEVDYRSSGHAVLRSKKMAHGKQRSYESAASPNSAMYCTTSQSRACSSMAPLSAPFRAPFSAPLSGPDSALAAEPASLSAPVAPPSPPQPPARGSGKWSLGGLMKLLGSGSGS